MYSLHIGGDLLSGIPHCVCDKCSTHLLCQTCLSCFHNTGSLLSSDLQWAAKPAQNMHLEEAARADVRVAGDCFLLNKVAQNMHQCPPPTKQLVICRNIKKDKQINIWSGASMVTDVGYLHGAPLSCQQQTLSAKQVKWMNWLETGAEGNYALLKCHSFVPEPPKHHNF